MDRDRSIEEIEREIQELSRQPVKRKYYRKLLCKAPSCIKDRKYSGYCYRHTKDYLPPEEYAILKQRVAQRVKEYAERYERENPELYKQKITLANQRAKERHKERMITNPIYKEKYLERARKKALERYQREQPEREVRDMLLKQLPAEDVWKMIGYTPGGTNETSSQVDDNSNSIN